jgi:hypothetical protein
MADFNSVHTGDEIDASVAVAFGRFVDTTNQAIAVADTAQSILFNTNSEVESITHSTSTATDEFTIVNAGVYAISAQPQVQNNGGTAQSFYMWVELDTGGGFSELANSNIKLDLGANDDAVTILDIPVRCAAADKIRIRVSATHTNVRMFTETPGAGPVVPSVILNLMKISR